MRCVYINLDKSVDRRRALERNFNDAKKETWSLTRFPAYDAEYVRNSDIQGILLPEEKACFLSHAEVIRRSLAEPGNTFVLEDDCLFGKRTCEFVDSVLPRLDQMEWDMLFTEVGVSHLEDMSTLFSIKKDLVQQTAIRLLDLRTIPSFYGATAYVVNGRSKAKITALLDQGGRFDTGYDLHLRNLIQSGKIAAPVLFPFVTSISDLANRSMIQPGLTQKTDHIWNTFRRMIWLEGDFRSLERDLREIERSTGREARAFSILFGGILDRKFQPK